MLSTNMTRGFFGFAELLQHEVDGGDGGAGRGQPPPAAVAVVVHYSEPGRQALPLHPHPARPLWPQPDLSKAYHMNILEYTMNILGA